MKNTLTLIHRSGGRSRTGRWFKQAFIAATLLVASMTQAQILVGPTGAPADDFSIIPAATSWSTLSLAGASGDPESIAAVDVLVNAQTAAGVTAAVATSAANPPATLATAQWSSSGLYLSTRPTGNAVTLLMATLQNTSGGALNAVTINYTYQNRVNPTANELIPTHRVYYSLSGAAGTWTPLGNYGPAQVYTPVNVAIPLDLAATPWPDTSLMYLMFADDNSQPNNDAANGIDDFAVAVGLPPCPGITNSPQSLTITQCVVNAVSFTVATTGAVVSVQWERDSGGGFAAIPGANNATYTLTPVGLADSGSLFRAVVSGSGTCTPLTSGSASLTVIADITGPVPLFAYGGTNNNTVTVEFNETINTNQPAPIDVAGNYILTDTNTGLFVTINAAIPFANSRGYVLQTDPLDPTHGYTLTLSSTLDACADNQMFDVTIPVNSFISTPLGLHANWRYLDNDIDPAANWFQSGFDDSAWLSAAGPFDAKRNAGGPGINCRPANSFTNYFTDGTFTVPHSCFNLESPVTLTNLITAYFRTTFNYSGKTNATLLELQSKFDDAAVVYLNGVALTRIALPAAPAVITDTTLATRTVGDTEREDIARFYNTTSLHNGQNLIAVEVHQQSLTSSDLTMGLRLLAYTTEQLCAAGSPTIVYNGGNVTITWGGGGILQQSTDISSPANWSNVPASPTSPYTTAATGSAKFYRVVCP